MASREDFQQFFQWVQDNRLLGTRIEKDGLAPAPYIPLEVLKEYWTPERVLLFLDCIVCNLSAHDVTEGYLEIFATLVYISRSSTKRLAYLNDFCRQSRDDNQLPFRQKNDLVSIFSDLGDGRSALEDFYNCQFLFHPQQLSDGKRSKLLSTYLASEDVLPIKFEEDLHRPRSATQLKKFELLPSSGLITRADHLVAKIFPEEEHTGAFQNELEAYSTLNRANYDLQDSEHFLNYYGSFIQNGRGVILLEYADQGSLLEFFKRNSLPNTREEMFYLYSSLVKLFLGLAELHNLRRKGNKPIGIHQDLKPSNLFVFSKPGFPSGYRFRFKIGDFGLSSFKNIHEPQDDHMPDNKSTRIYGAPELMTWHKDLDHIDYGVTYGADMWSMGCVLLEFAVWSICGHRGLEEFLADRKEETAVGHPSCRGSFHNGARRLQAIDNMVQKILTRRRIYDNLTKPFCEWICHCLLIPGRNNRLNGDQAVYQLEELMGRAMKAEFSPYTSMYNELVALPNGINSSPPPSSSLSPVTPNSNRPSPDYPPHLTRNSSVGNKYPYRPVHNTSRSTDSGRLRDSYQGTTESGSSANQLNTQDDVFDPTTGVGGTMNPVGLSRPGTWIAGTNPGGNVTDLFNPPTILDPSPFPKADGSPGAVRTDTLSHMAGQNQAYHINKEGLGPVPSHRPPESSTGSTLKPNTFTRRASSSLSAAASVATAREVHTAENITIKQLIAWRAGKKNGGSDALPRELQDIPGMLANRDQVFLIDNSQSMLTHWVDVREAIEALAYVVKNIDLDGIEMRFTSKSTESYKSKNTTHLLTKVDLNKPAGQGKCMMESALNNLIDSLMPPSGSNNRPSSSIRSLGRTLIGRSSSVSKTGISVYILTNGVWTGSNNMIGGAVNSDGGNTRPNLCGVDKSVKTLVERLQRNGHTRNFMTLQFIRFGRDRLGKQRLRCLDNDIEEAAQWDIVDRRYHRGAVKPMLIGAIGEEDYPSDDSLDDEPA